MIEFEMSDTILQQNTRKSKRENSIVGCESSEGVDV
jgi:hypothetical protein